MVFYLTDVKGNAKTTGNPYHRITLAEVQTKEGKLQGRVVDFFADGEISTSNLEFGDVVKPIFKESELLGGKPSLVGLEKTDDSPIKVLNIQ